MINKCKKYWLLLVLVLVGQASCQWESISEDRRNLLTTCDYAEKDLVRGCLLKHKFVPIEVALEFNDGYCEDYFFGLSSAQWEIYRQQSQRAVSEGRDLFKQAFNSGFGSVSKTNLLVRRGLYDSGSFWLNLKHKASLGFLSRGRPAFDFLNKYYSYCSDDHITLRGEVEKKSSVVKSKWGAYFAGKLSSLLTSTPKYNSCSAGVPVAVDRDDCKSNNLPTKPKDDTVNSDTKIKPFAVRAASAHHRGVKPIDVERLPGQHVKLPALKDRRGRSFSRR